MARAFLVVMDSAGIGGAPDADAYFNNGVPDTGANTLGHIAQACAAGQAEEGRSGPLKVPHMAALGLGRAIEAASGMKLPSLEAPLTHRAIGSWPECRCLGIGIILRTRKTPFRVIWWPR